MWLLAVTALVGNTFVIASRLRAKHSHTRTIAHVQSILICNLATSDLLMGFYMLVIALSDAVIGESFFWEGKAEEWRASHICRFAGFLSFLSLEASVFLITLISVDRFISVWFPYTSHRLGIMSARVTTGLIWAVSIILSVISVLLSARHPDVYDLSDVCVGLPLTRKNADVRVEVDQTTLNAVGIKQNTTVAYSSATTWQYATAVFLGVNFICLAATLVAYIAIFCRVRLVSASLGRRNISSNEMRMALKLSLIIITNLLCWLPIIILGIIVQNSDDVDISPNVYAWLVALVLPINSAINPYLYTIVDKYALPYGSSTGSSRRNTTTKTNDLSYK